VPFKDGTPKAIFNIPVVQKGTPQACDGQYTGRIRAFAAATWPPPTHTFIIYASILAEVFAAMTTKARNTSQLSFLQLPSHNRWPYQSIVCIKETVK